MMRILIGGFLMTLGFIFGVMHDQQTVVFPLQRVLQAEQERNAVLDRALELATKNIYKKRDAIWMAIQEVNRASR